VAANNSQVPQTVTVDASNERRVFKGLWPSGTRDVRSTATGEVTVTVPPLSAVVWKAAAPLARTKAAPMPEFTTGPAVSGRTEVGVDVPGDGFDQVTFAVRPAGTSEWTVLGTDDNAPYRVFHDVRDLSDGTVLECRAVLRTHSGDLAAAGASASVAPEPQAPAPVTGQPDPVGDGAPVAQPASVTVAGDLDTEMGCTEGWQPACEQAQMVLDPDTQVWSLTKDLPAGDYQYKVALDGTWDESYGDGAARNGPDIGFSHTGGPIRFFYDHRSHWVTSDVQGPIITAPGSFQSQLGCPGNWMPDCLRPWLQDLDGDGTHTGVTTQLAAGDYEVKVTHGLSWGRTTAPVGPPVGPTSPSPSPRTAPARSSSTTRTATC
jgi:hypothetical protein